MSGSGFANYLVTKTGFLVRTVVKSVDYVAGASGWAIFKNGDAEFNNVTIRGAEIVNGNVFVYAGAPALGNLIGSIAWPAGTDGEGNPYPAGLYGELTTNGVAFTSGAQLSSAAAGTGVTLDDGPLESIAGTPADPTVISTDDWNTLALTGSGWSGTLQCKMMPDLTVMLRTKGTLAVGTRTTGTVIATLPTSPVNYAPAVQLDMPLIVTANSSGAAAVNSPFITIATDGEISVANISAQAATNVALLGSYPLD